MDILSFGIFWEGFRYIKQIIFIFVFDVGFITRFKASFRCCSRFRFMAGFITRIVRRFGIIFASFRGLRFSFSCNFSSRSSSGHPRWVTFNVLIVSTPLPTSLIAIILIVSYLDLVHSRVG